MSTENIIKKQAKTALKGNWVLLITSIAFVLILLLAAVQLSNLVLVILGAVNLETGEVKEGKELLYFCVTFGFYGLAFFLTPLVNGIIRMFCNISKGKSIEAGNVFYYFKGAKRYFRTVFENVLIASLYFAASHVFDLYGYISDFTERSLGDGHSTDLLTVALILSGLFSIIAKTLIYFIFVHYPLIAYSYYDGISPLKSNLDVIKFSLANLGSTLNLFFDFIGWMLLCFFVVPAIYVVPYMITSFTTSAKWLLPEEDAGRILC